MQSSGLLNHIFLSFFYPGQRFSNLAHSFSAYLFWHQPHSIYLVFLLALLIWVSRTVFLWPLLLHAFFLSDHTILTFALWRSLLSSYTLLLYPIPDWFLFAIFLFHKLGRIFISKFFFQKPLIYWLLFLSITMFRIRKYKFLTLTSIRQMEVLEKQQEHNNKHSWRRK